MRGRLYGRDLFDPLHICKQIGILQLFFWTSLTVTASIFTSYFGGIWAWSLVFNSSSITFSSSEGWSVISALFVTSLLIAFCVSIVVERMKKSIDFSFTVYFLHFVVASFVEGTIFHNAVWWIVMAFTFICTAALSEYLCLRREMADISIDEIMSHRSSRNVQRTSNDSLVEEITETGMVQANIQNLVLVQNEESLPLMNQGGTDSVPSQVRSPSAFFSTVGTFARRALLNKSTDYTSVPMSDTISSKATGIKTTGLSTITSHTHIRPNVLSEHPAELANINTSNLHSSSYPNASPIASDVGTPIHGFASPKRNLINPAAYKIGESVATSVSLPDNFLSESSSILPLSDNSVEMTTVQSVMENSKQTPVQTTMLGETGNDDNQNSVPMHSALKIIEALQQRSSSSLSSDSPFNKRTARALFYEDDDEQQMNQIHHSNISAENSPNTTSSNPSLEKQDGIFNSNSLGPKDTITVNHIDNSNELYQPSSSTSPTSVTTSFWSVLGSRRNSLPHATPILEDLFDSKEERHVISALPFSPQQSVPLSIHNALPTRGPNVPMPQHKHFIKKVEEKRTVLSESSSARAPASPHLLVPYDDSSFRASPSIFSHNSSESNEQGVRKLDHVVSSGEQGMSYIKNIKKA